MFLRLDLADNGVCNILIKICARFSSSAAGCDLEVRSI
jgi:hypothetical protein